MSDCRAWEADRAEEEEYRRVLAEAKSLGIPLAALVQLRHIRQLIMKHRNTLPYGFVTDFQHHFLKLTEELDKRSETARV